MQLSYYNTMHAVIVKTSYHVTYSSACQNNKTFGMCLITPHIDSTDHNIINYETRTSKIHVYVHNSPQFLKILNVVEAAVFIFMLRSNENVSI